jgi:hypothetical protein
MHCLVLSRRIDEHAFRLGFLTSPIVPKIIEIDIEAIVILKYPTLGLGVITAMTNHNLSLGIVKATRIVV